MDGGVNLSKYELYMQVDAVQRFLADIYDREQRAKQKESKPQTAQNEKEKGTINHE